MCEVSYRLFNDGAALQGSINTISSYTAPQFLGEASQYRFLFSNIDCAVSINRTSSAEANAASFWYWEPAPGIPLTRAYPMAFDATHNACVPQVFGQPQPIIGDDLTAPQNDGIPNPAGLGPNSLDSFLYWLDPFTGDFYGGPDDLTTTVNRLDIFIAVYMAVFHVFPRPNLPGIKPVTIILPDGRTVAGFGPSGGPTQVILPKG